MNDDEQTLMQRLQAHVQTLAGDIGERNMWRPAAFMGDQQGSMVYAGLARDRGDNIRLMASLETIEVQTFQSSHRALRVRAPTKSFASR